MPGSSPVTSAASGSITLSSPQPWMPSQQYSGQPASACGVHRARYVPDGTANRGEWQSLTDKPIRPPAWDAAGDGGSPDDLLSSRPRSSPSDARRIKVHGEPPLQSGPPCGQRYLYA